MAEIFTLSKNNTAEIKDKVVFLKIGLFKYEFPIQSITGLYRYNLTTANDLLVISYRIGNKTKRLQIVLDRVIPQPFVDELTSCIPASANLLHMKKKEALKIIGVGDGVKHGVIALAILVPLILAGIFFPQIYHSVFDSKLAHTTLEDIYKGNLPDSKYLAFTAELQNQGMIVTYRKFTSRTRSKKGFYALVPEGWKRGEPVRVVLMADGQFYIDLVNAKIGKKTEVRGIVRDVLWEKFSWSGWMDNLAEHEKSPVVDPVVIEIEADTAAILGISYIAVFVIVITFLCFKLWDFYRRRGGTTL